MCKHPKTKTEDGRLTNLKPLFLQGKKYTTLNCSYFYSASFKMLSERSTNLTVTSSQSIQLVKLRNAIKFYTI